MIQNEKLMIRKINDKNNRKNKRGQCQPLPPQEPTTNDGHCGVKYYSATVGQCQCVVVYQEVIVSM